MQASPQAIAASTGEIQWVPGKWVSTRIDFPTDDTVKANRSGQAPEISDALTSAPGATPNDITRALVRAAMAKTSGLRFRAGSGRKYAVARFLGALGPRTQEEPRISRYRIEFDATDERVAVGRPRRSLARWLRLFSYWRAIARASR